MKLAQVSFSLAMLLGASAFGIPHFKHFEKFAIDSGLALAGLNGIALLNSATKYGGSCNPANVKIRREWYDRQASHETVAVRLTLEQGERSPRSSDETTSRQSSAFWRRTASCRPGKCRAPTRCSTTLFTCT